MKQTSPNLTKEQNEQLLRAIEEKPFRGTSYYYTAGHVVNYRACYTKSRMDVGGRRLFWSWIERRNKDGSTKITKRAGSGSAKRAEERAHKLLNKKIERLQKDNSPLYFKPYHNPTRQPDIPKL